ncbi:Spb1 C-terminal domain-containing protein [Fimicolochytrium jonesii]|uniref:Spb1 C-terminal domain-containing protein n=1 Tax=Fimicolochytrium jonesii TaxID=1396493 RepID=UPI0022FE15B5|nr:Spb1 C-terminal domain-containing protein [Fimicolochytrium jonesii]KAI8822006.1 Spb1 C-terminal domain-containing protein [Fimicolochytrium jonesii]
MGTKKKFAKGRLDKYYYMAKEQGYRARSAFKLIQLNKKYNFLEKSKCLVDLCAAPGGWLQVASKYMPKPNIIVGLDLAAIKPIPGVITHVEDITTQKCRATLKKELKTWKADVFLHDGAPNVGTSWLQDAFTQSELVLASLKLATEFLMPGGVFVSKVFRSKDYNKLIWVFNQFFEKVEATKPASSRNVSAEIFVVCREFKAPKKIDPRLLDPKYVFKEVDDVAEEDMDEKKKKERQGALLNDLFHPEKRRRHRSGYADGDYTLHIANSIGDFIKGPDFLTALTSSNELRFDTDDFSRSIGEHPITTEEIKQCCKDLKVLGKKDFKDLLKWRDALRLDLGLAKKKEEDAEKAPEENEQPDDPETLAERLNEESKVVAARLKREKRKARERKAKQLLKFRLGMGTPSDIGLDASAEAGGLGTDNINDDGSLFHLNGLPADEMKKSRAMVAAEQAAADLMLTDDESEGDYDDSEDDAQDDDEEYDSDEDVKRKVNAMESQLDDLYEKFCEQRLERDPSAKVRKAKEGAKAFEEWYGIEFDSKQSNPDAVPGTADSDSTDDSEDYEDEDAMEIDEPAPKPAVAKGKKRKASAAIEPEEEEEAVIETKSLSKRARTFFDNPLFKSLEEPVKKPQKANGKPEKAGLFAKEMTAADDDSTDDEDSVPKRKAKGKKNSGFTGDESDSEQEAGGAGFEVVPAGLDANGQPTDDFAITTAEAYTLAQRMLRKSGKRDVIDEAYNRFAHNDPDNLPAWFVEEENRHNKPSLPITKEAVAIIKQKQRALDARPIKKVAEAKFRKQMRTARRLEKMQKKASNVMDDEGGELTEKSKLLEVSKLKRRAKAKADVKKKPTLVVARGLNRGKQGRPKGVKGRYKMVDPRMKKEMRAEKRAAKAGKKRRK